MSGCGTRIVLRGQKPLALCDRCPCFGSLFPPLAALTFAASSIICAFGLALSLIHIFDEISSRYALMIENMVDEESWPLVQTMVKEYCAYVRRYSLDVYKRQLLANTVSLLYWLYRTISVTLASKGKKPPSWLTTSTPVSYTHLDVYKRQA